MKKVLNILIPLFILLGVLDLLIYRSNQEEEIVYEEIDEYEEIIKTPPTDVYSDDFIIPNEEHNDEKFTLRIEQICNMTPSNVRLLDEFSQIFYPIEIIPYISKTGKEYSFLQFEDLPKGFYHLSIENSSFLNSYSNSIEIKNSMTLSYKELISSFYSRTDNDLITNNDKSIIPLVISIYNMGENCHQNIFTISRLTKQNNDYNVVFNSLSSNFTKEYIVKETFWQDIVNLEFELSKMSDKKRINGKIEFLIRGVRTYSNTSDFELKLFNIIEKHQY